MSLFSLVSIKPSPDHTVTTIEHEGQNCWALHEMANHLGFTGYSRISRDLEEGYQYAEGDHYFKLGRLDLDELMMASGSTPREESGGDRRSLFLALKGRRAAVLVTEAGLLNLWRSKNAKRKVIAKFANTYTDLVLPPVKGVSETILDAWCNTRPGWVTKEDLFSFFSYGKPDEMEEALEILTAPEQPHRNLLIREQDGVIHYSMALRHILFWALEQSFADQVQ